MTDLFNDLWSEISPFFSGMRQERDAGQQKRAGGRKRVMLVSSALVAGVLVVAAGTAILLGGPGLRERDRERFLSQPARLPAEVASPVPLGAPAPEAQAPVADAPATPPPTPPAELALPPVAPPATLRVSPVSRDVVPDSVAPTSGMTVPRSASGNAPRPAQVETRRTPAPSGIVAQPGPPAQEPTAREAADDGGAIIDWLFNEGSPRR
jgi:hypothetical protein